MQAARSRQSILVWVILWTSCFFLPLNRGWAQGNTRQLTAVRDLLIDAATNDLSDVRFVDAFANGTVVVAQPQDHALRFFSIDGRPLGTFGRAGGGPGEFGLLSWAHGFVGDTLLAIDGSLNRLTLITASGKLGRTVPVPGSIRLGVNGNLPGSGMSSVRAMDESGALLVEVLLSRASRPPSAWTMVLGGRRWAVMWVSPSGDFQRLIAGESDAESVCGTAPNLLMECPRPMSASGPSGALNLFVTTDVDGPHGGTLLATAIRSTGDTLFSRRYQFVRVPYPSRRVDSIRAAVRAHAASPAIAAFWQKATFPTIYRPVQHLFVGHDETTWIGFHATEAGVPWLILNRDGSQLGMLTVSANVSIHAGDAHTFWGTVSDDDGLESVVRYRLIRP